MAADKTVAADDLREFVYGVLEKAGYPDNYAQDISDGLVEADLRGRSSFGVVQLQNIVKRTRLGLIDPQAQPKALATAPSITRLDAQNAPGIPMGTHGMSLAITKARTTGVGVVTMLNSTDYGMGALHAELGALAGTIGIALTNAAPAIAASGGAQPVIGTNPLSIAIPGKEGAIALSLDLEMDQSTIGLAIAAEMLTGVLSGGALGPEVGSFLADVTRPQRTSHFFMAIEWRHFLRQPDYEERIGFLTGWLKGSARVSGSAPLGLPGEQELADSERRQREGASVDGAAAAALVALGKDLGVVPPAGLA